jgi:hypothetical protein
MHAYCLMDNRFHLVVETPDANLSRAMRQLNGVYTQAFNRRHGRVGHVLQGRFKAIVVDRDSYLLELCRYVVLNRCVPGALENLIPIPGRAIVRPQDSHLRHPVLRSIGCCPSSADSDRLLSGSIGLLSPRESATTRPGRMSKAKCCSATNRLSKA